MLESLIRIRFLTLALLFAMSNSSAVACFPADFSGSGAFGNDDLTLLLDNWGKEVPPIPDRWVGTPPTAPLVSNDDLTFLLDNWGNISLSESYAVPEPSTLLLLGIAATIILQINTRNVR